MRFYSAGRLCNRVSDTLAPHTTSPRPPTPTSNTKRTVDVCCICVCVCNVICTSKMMFVYVVAFLAVHKSTIKRKTREAQIPGKHFDYARIVFVCVCACLMIQVHSVRMISWAIFIVGHVVAAAYNYDWFCLRRTRKVYSLSFNGL